MAKFYVYYCEDTEDTFATVYEWNHNEDTVRRYCSHVGSGRYTHTDIQLDIESRILTDKRTGDKYALVSAKKPRKNLKYESIPMQTPVAWEDQF